MWALPVVWLGDFGTTPGSETHTALLEGEPPPPEPLEPSEVPESEGSVPEEPEGGPRARERPVTAHAGGRSPNPAAGKPRPGTAKEPPDRGRERSPSPVRGYAGHPPNSVQRRLLAQRDIGRHKDTSVAMERPAVHEGDPLEGLIFLDVHASDYMLPPR